MVRAWWAAGAGVLAMVVAGCAGAGATGTTGTGGAVKGDAVLDKAVGILQEQFRSGDAAARANCVEGMQSLFDPRSTAMIHDALEDPEWVVRFAGAMAAGRRKLEELKPTLSRLMTGDANGSVRAAAAYALGRMGDSGHDDVIRAALVDADPGVRANAALVLGIAGDRGVLDLLRQRAAAERDERVRLEITGALARLGDPEARRVIVAQAMSKYGEDEWMAMDVCGDLGGDGTAARALLLGLEDAPKQAGPDVRPLTVTRQLVAARSLARLGSIEGANVAVIHLTDPDPQLRGLAALALGEILSPIGAQQRLGPLLTDGDAVVRRAAAAAVVKVYVRAAR